MGEGRPAGCLRAGGSLARMAQRPWSRFEVEKTVQDYMEMLSLQLRGEKFIKTHRNARLRELLDNRSRTAVEFKFRNISSVLLDLGLPYVIGYRPATHVQDLLREVVAGHISDALLKAVAQDVESIAQVRVEDSRALKVVGAPQRNVPQKVRDERWTPSDGGIPADYLRREERNRSLGVGEALVMAYERARLRDAGRDHLAGKVEQVSKTKGDRAGYDIHSYELNGQDRLVEVKTTRYGQYTPFYISASEVKFSATNWDKYHLYRVFEFRTRPKLFVLPGDVSTNVNLEAVNFRAGL